MPKKYDKILKSVLKKIKPSKEQEKRLKKISSKVLRLVNSTAKKYKAKAILAGSLTRNTWLPDKNEFDVFLLFPEKMKKKRLEELGLKIGRVVIRKLKGSYKVEYAEHPYVSGKIGDVSVDIVPCYALESTEKLKSAVDRTPFHVKYLEKHLPLRLSSDVRLLKQFLEANEMYGADAKVEGYSGYLCELLVINYRSFINVLKAATKWNPGEIIDMENVYPKSDYGKLRKKFWNEPLIFLDPVDPNRNVAAALSSKNFFKFKKLAKEFLSTPKEDFFFPKEYKPLTEDELIRFQISRRTELLIIKFIPPKVVPDILWPQLRRFAERLKSILEEKKYEFRVLGKDVYTDGKFFAVVLLEMEVSKLPMIQKRIGPLVFDKIDSERFIKKYKEQALAGPYVEGNHWVVEVKRDFLTAREKIIDSLSKPLDILLAKGIPKYIAERIANGFDVFSENEQIMHMIKRNPEFGIFLRRYFEKEKLV